MTHKDIQLPVATGVTDGPALRAEYERGFIDGMQEQMRRSVDRAVNAMMRRWVGLTDEEMKQVCYEACSYDPCTIARAIEAKLKERNT